MNRGELYGIVSAGGFTLLFNLMHCTTDTFVQFENWTAISVSLCGDDTVQHTPHLICIYIVPHLLLLLWLICLRASGLLALKIIVDTPHLLLYYPSYIILCGGVMSFPYQSLTGSA